MVPYYFDYTNRILVWPLSIRSYIFLNYEYIYDTVLNVESKIYSKSIYIIINIRHPLKKFMITSVEVCISLESRPRATYRIFSYLSILNNDLNMYQLCYSSHSCFRWNVKNMLENVYLLFNSTHKNNLNLSSIPI